MGLSAFFMSILGNSMVALGIIAIVFLGTKIRKKLTTYLDYIIAVTVGVLLGIVFL
jgi:uncharacterized membrane protein YgaE (UPF0421/DUF939 family)